MFSQEIVPYTPKSADEMVKQNLIVKHYAGSHAYGMSLPTSDVDFRGIFCAEPANILTPFFNVRECEDKLEEDTKYYELAHFMKLCLDCNPNIIETLWVDPIDVVQGSEAYDLLHKHRHKLLSSKIAFTTTGYAFAQLKRIKGHNKWINNPQPENPPQPVDFVSLIQWFGEEKLLPSDFHLRDFQWGWRLVPYGHNLFGLIGKNIQFNKYRPYNNDGSLNDKFDKLKHDLPNPTAIIKFNKEEYKTAKEKYEQYWSWKMNRNKVRAELEEEYGYDSKHAAHLVRLLRIGLEALQDGKIIVKRPDAQELIDIRNGKWSYDNILNYAEEMDREIRVWYHKTELPKKPDVKFAAGLLMEVQKSIWSK